MGLCRPRVLEFYVTLKLTEFLLDYHFSAKSGKFCVGLYWCVGDPKMALCFMITAGTDTHAICTTTTTTQSLPTSHPPAMPPPPSPLPLPPTPPYCLKLCKTKTFYIVVDIAEVNEVLSYATYYTRSAFVPCLSRRAQSGTRTSFGRRVWFTESHTVLGNILLLDLFILDIKVVLLSNEITK